MRHIVKYYFPGCNKSVLEALKERAIAVFIVCLQISPCWLILKLEQGKKGLENTKIVAVLE